MSSEIDERMKKCGYVWHEGGWVRPSSLDDGEDKITALAENEAQDKNVKANDVKATFRLDGVEHDLETVENWVVKLAEKNPSAVVGVKYDTQKPRFSLLPLKPLMAVVEVLELGARKYAPDNWKKVENAQDRYFDALMRHMIAWKMGEKYDPETGLNHLAHAACSVLFMLWFDQQEVSDD